MSTSQRMFPFPSYVSVASFVTLKLNDTNFLMWKQQILSLIRSQRLEGFLTGRTPIPSEFKIVKEGDVDKEVPNPDYDDWLQTDNLLKSWICGTITEEVMCYIVDLDTSAEVWNTLVHKFVEQTVEKEFELNAKLQRLSKDNKTMDVYLREFKQICDQLNAIGKPVDSRRKIYSLLEGLPRDYEIFRTPIYHTVFKMKEPCCEDIVTELRAFETRIQKYSVTAPADFNMVYMAQRGGYKRKNNGSGRGYRSHDNSKNEFQYSTQGRGFMPQSFTSQQDSKSDKGKNETNSEKGVQCQICDRRGHSAKRCWFRFDNSIQNQGLPSAMAAMHLSTGDNTVWFPDTGVTAHVTDATGFTEGQDIAERTQGERAV